MKITRLILCSLALAIHASAASAIGMVSGGSDDMPLPPIAQPLPAEIGAQWLILPGVRYHGARLYECPREGYSSSRAQPPRCAQSDEIGGFSVQEELSRKFGQGYEAVGISPFLDGEGQEIGVVLYYKKNEREPIRPVSGGN